MPGPGSRPSSSGVFLLVLVVGLGDVVAIIPMAALVAVMVMVSVATFDWHSIKPSTLRACRVGETVVMVLTVVIVVATDNLAIGVIVGVVAAMIVFARRVAALRLVARTIETLPTGEPTRSTRRRRTLLRFEQRPHHAVRLRRRPRPVVIDMTRVARLGRFHRRRTRRDRDEVPRHGKRVDIQGHERGQPGVPRPPRREPRRRSLTSRPPPATSQRPVSVGRSPGRARRRTRRAQTGRR